MTRWTLFVLTLAAVVAGCLAGLAIGQGGGASGEPLPTLTPICSCACVTQTPTATATPVPPPTVTPAATPTPRPGNLKRGLGVSTWPGDDLDVQAFADMGFSWGHFWSPYVAEWQGNPAFEVVPMIHMADVFEGMEDNPAVQRAAYVLFLNEPDATWSGDYRRADGYRYAQYDYANGFRQAWLAVNEVNPGVRWIVGNVFDPNTTGRTWFSNFVTAYKNVYGSFPPIAGFGIHNYPGRYDKADWRNRMMYFRNWQVSMKWGGYEVWLTEFAMLSSESVSLQIVKDQVTRERWLDGQAWVTRYAWFVSHSSQMAGSVMRLVGGQYVSGSHTAIGSEFAAHK